MTSDERTDTEKWLEDKLKLPMIQVWFVGHDGRLVDERHVADPDTIFETVKMSIERLGLKSAALPYEGRWCVYTPRRAPPNNLRYFDTREAAEMVVIHNG